MADLNDYENIEETDDNEIEEEVIDLKGTLNLFQYQEELTITKIN